MPIMSSMPTTSSVPFNSSVPTMSSKPTCAHAHARRAVRLPCDTRGAATAAVVQVPLLGLGIAARLRDEGLCSLVCGCGCGCVCVCLHVLVCVSCVCDGACGVAHTRHIVDNNPNLSHVIYPAQICGLQDV